MSDPQEPLIQRLRALHRQLQAAEGAAGPRLDGVLGRLERDLLPRTAGGHEHLVVGIVGPNNAGKSSLFNALVAGDGGGDAGAPATVSPAEPTGGATRRLVGAASPALRAALEAEPTLRRFQLRPAGVGPGGVAEAREAASPGDEGALLLADTEALPDSLLLVDTPDFDSVLRENRAVTDALLTVADVAVVVVTRHTYQNHDVIAFLSGWLEHGRPWVLVYNEALDEATTAAHAAKVEADLGHGAEAVFAAPFDPRIAAGEAGLRPRLLGDPGVSLASWLRRLGDRGELKERAMAASLAALREELVELVEGTRRSAEAIDAARGALRGPAGGLGRAVAREAMPMGPFLEAFRDVLDERPSAVQRELRRGLRWTGDRLLGGVSWARRQLLGGGAAAAKDGDSEGRTLLDVERAELERRWAGYHEPAQRVLRDLIGDPELPREAVEALGARVREGGSPRVSFERAASALALDPGILEEHRAACRDIIREELDRQGSEAFLQLAVDVVHLLPLGLAGVLIVHTGGLGTDVAVAGGGAAAAALAERLSRTLGTGVALTARSRWTALRAERIADAALAGALGDAAEVLDRLEAQGRALGEVCEEWASDASWRWGQAGTGSEPGGERA